MGEKSYRDLCREIGIRMDTPEDEEKILLLVNMVLWGIDDVREARGKLKQLRRNTDEYKT